MSKVLSALLLLILCAAFVWQANAQSMPAPSGDAPNWGWFAGVFLSIIVMFSLASISTLRRTLDKLREDLDKLKTEVNDDHLDKETTKEMIITTMRLTMAEELPKALRPLEDKVTNLQITIGRQQ